MKWISTNEELPNEHKRYLGYCYNEYDNSSWKGIVEVYFDPQTGWHRCENRDEKPVRVLYWMDLPQLPEND